MVYENGDTLKFLLYCYMLHYVHFCYLRLFMCLL